MLLLLAACDPSRLALDPIPFDAGTAPVGGGGIDRRLVGCTWRSSVGGSVWEQVYDGLGRPVSGEGRDGGEVWYAFEIRYDAFGCPVEVVETGPDWEGSFGTTAYTQGCDLHGYVDRVFAEGEEVWRMKNRYDLAGHPVRVTYLTYGEPIAETSYEWHDHRVVGWEQRDPETDELVWNVTRTFEDGWVLTLEEDGERMQTWTYDPSGRAVSEETDDGTTTYGYADDAAEFPSTVRAGGTEGTIAVECG